MSPISKEFLTHAYVVQKLSSVQIAKVVGCSAQKVNYWLQKYSIQKRSIGAAIYARRNPKGDPFTFKKPQDTRSYFLFGLGIGLYWGEGTKKNKHSIRLGNTDPRLIRLFIVFLKTVYAIDTGKLRYGLQVFSDMSSKETLSFWKKQLAAHDSQFQKVVRTPARSIGTYREKSKYGVLTVYFNNKKLRDSICGAIEDIDAVLLGIT